ncbi:MULTISPECIES: Kazal-type serine protease inhibitor domain-containing protein [unclassified Rhizobium]|uniref:Kazal-type serine protease inhibitor family protein n=1 Tax=unclassified Rhizobium TaxID=2613769 RepID=UPI00104DE27E|nr:MULTISPECIES: Kazal-type serine protease inhibitor domain-containing protein [unclassified Rhizobium]MBB3394643.1 hypothetical protein [Rhizobium sp. BK060]TCM79101.1 Kazal-type serine protease inhibitor-like protein [Rhizobium sp. BK068]
MTLAGFLSLRQLALLALIPLLCACTVDVGPSYSRPRPPPPLRPAGPQMCTMEYAPVCGQRGARVQTFSNACQARAANFTVISRGQCRRQPGITIRPQPPAPPRPGGICTREYRPVCGQRGPQMRTFPNACEAGNGGFRIISQGTCRR